MEFLQFVHGVGKGLWAAYSTDPDVFLIGTGGLLAGRGWRRGLGLALLGLVIARRGDQYMAVFVRQTDSFRQVMTDGMR